MASERKLQITDYSSSSCARASMELIVILVLGLAVFTTQESKESLMTRNLKKLDRFPAIQSFLKHLYAHEIQGVPHVSGNDGSDHHHEYHDHWHGPQDGNRKQKEKTSSYTNIQNVNVIVKGNKAANPLDKLEPLLKNMKSAKEIYQTVPRCGDGRCDDDRKNKHQNRGEESLDEILNDIKPGIMNNVKPVLPYWGEMNAISVNSNSYDDQQDYELRCGCNRVPQREGTNGNGQYDLRCGCGKKPNIFRSEILEEDEKYDLRCGCNRVSEREGNNGNGKYNLRCGCKKQTQGYIYQRKRPEDNEQYNLRCGCDRVSQRENNGQYDLRCGCSRSFEREGMESNGQYDMRCGCGRISQDMDDNGRYNLRCGCSRGSQREGIEFSSQYDLRCGCSKASQREGVGSNGQYDLRCGCSRSSTEGVMDENTEQYDLRCGCNKNPHREGNSNGQLDLRCGCTDRRGRNYGDLVEIQAPLHDSKNIISIGLDDVDEDQNSVINGKNRLVNEVNEEPPVTYPDSIYMGLDPNDKYFTKINKDMKSKVSPQEMVTFYNAWKEQMIDNLVSYILGDSDAIDQSHMTQIQRRIVRNLRSTLSKLEYVDGRKLRNRISSLLFGIESQSRVLPHDDRSQNVYVPRWVHSLLQKHASDKKSIRKGRVSWFPMSKKQKLRLQTIIQKQRATNNAEPRNLRRSQSSDAGYGVPFEMDVQGLAQVNS